MAEQMEPGNRSERAGQYRPKYPVPPDGDHARNFNKAIRDLLMHNKLGFTEGQTEEVELQFKVRVEERDNPGWVIEYIVEPRA
jgi:hypothetical protein